MIEELPGYQEANALGYSMYSYSGNMDSARYGNDDGLMLHVWRDDTGTFATLSYVSGLITLSTDRISFPNRNFYVFESQLRDIVMRLV